MSKDKDPKNKKDSKKPPARKRNVHPSPIMSVEEKKAKEEVAIKQLGEVLNRLPYVSALNQKIVLIDKQFEDTNSKISSLAGAITALNSEMTKMVDMLQGKVANAPTAPAPADSPLNQGPVVIGAPSASEQQPVLAQPTSRGDKALGWLQVLAELAKAGGSPSQTQPTSGTEQGIEKGIELGMATLGGMTKVMSEIFKMAADTVKSVGSISKSIPKD